YVHSDDGVRRLRRYDAHTSRARSGPGAGADHRKLEVDKELKQQQVPHQLDRDRTTPEIDGRSTQLDRPRRLNARTTNDGHAADRPWRGLLLPRLPHLP